MTLRRAIRDRLPTSPDRPHHRTLPRSGRSAANRRLAVLVAVTIAAMTAACGGSSSPRVTPASLTPEEIRERANQPLTLLGPCDITPTPAAIGDVPGLVLPEAAVPVERTDTEGLVNLRGYVAMTPIQVRLFYEDAAADGQFELLSAEDETQEAEVLVDVGDHRLYIKAAAVCELGSVFVVVTAPTTSAGAVPVPSGSASPG